MKKILLAYILIIFNIDKIIIYYNKNGIDCCEIYYKEKDIRKLKIARILTKIMIGLLIITYTYIIVNLIN